MAPPLIEVAVHSPHEGNPLDTEATLTRHELLTLTSEIVSAYLSNATVDSGFCCIARVSKGEKKEKEKKKKRLSSERTCVLALAIKLTASRCASKRVGE